ncbi:unnamed protein product, partial [Meganyctiphanes norvegica]
SSAQVCSSNTFCRILMKIGKMNAEPESQPLHSEALTRKKLLHQISSDIEESLTRQKLLRQASVDISESLEGYYKQRRPSITILPPLDSLPESGSPPSPSDETVHRPSFNYGSNDRRKSISAESIREPPSPFLDIDNKVELYKQLEELASKQPALGKNILRDARSYPFFCKHCEWETDSKVKSTPKTIAWATGTVIACMGCFCGCCCLPMAFDPCFDVTHSCPDCGQVAGPPPARYTETDTTWDWPPI